MDIKKYMKINRLSCRKFADLLNNMELRKKYKLPMQQIRHNTIAYWARKAHRPSLQSMKILQCMTNGVVSIKDFLNENSID